MCDYLDKLKNITPHLSDVPELNEFRSGEKNSEGMFEYKFKTGACMSLNLYNGGDAAIAKTYIPAGINFEEHVHKYSYEILIVLNGKLEVTTKEGSVLLQQYDKCELQRGQSHSAKALTDTKIIVITVPSAEGFPE